MPTREAAKFAVHFDRGTEHGVGGVLFIKSARIGEHLRLKIAE